MMRTHCPACTVMSTGWPANTPATTSSDTGVSAEALARSADRTAYPSMALLANVGTGSAAVTDSAVTHPSATASGQRTGSRALHPASTTARASSSGITSR